MSNDFTTMEEAMLPPPMVGVDGLRARVITRPNDRQKITFNRLVDPRTALARGLREYMEQLSIDWQGRPLRFRRVLQTWAEPEEPDTYPSASIINDGDAIYDASTFTPITNKVEDGSDRYVRYVAEVMQPFQLVLWTTDPQERLGLVAMVEDAFEPADFMTGLRLELPYYFGARATYEKLRLKYDDSSGDAQRRWRRAIINIHANVPQIRPVGELKLMVPQVDVQVGNTLGSEPKQR